MWYVISRLPRKSTSPELIKPSTKTMPAIHPARLKKQVAQLVNNFEQPDGFVRSLHQLMSYYAERIQRPGQSGEPTPLITAYKVRRPVLRQIQGALAPLAKSKPEAAITLCDALW